MIYDDKQFIGNVIKNARKKAGLKQFVLAEKIGMSEKNLGNIENGKQFPLLNNFFRILEILNLSVKDFGVNVQDTEVLVSAKEQLLREIYCLSDDDTEQFLNILNSIKIIKFSQEKS